MCEKLLSVIEVLKELNTLYRLDDDQTNSLRTETGIGMLFMEKQFGKSVHEIEPETIMGLHPDIATCIREIIQTGTCTKRERLRREYAHLLPLCKVKGVGAVYAKLLYKNGVNTTEEASRVWTTTRKNKISLRKYFEKSDKRP